jgi:hypothetical protein
MPPHQDATSTISVSWLVLFSTCKMPPHQDATSAISVSWLILFGEFPT